MLLCCKTKLVLSLTLWSTNSFKQAIQAQFTSCLNWMWREHHRELCRFVSFFIGHVVQYHMDERDPKAITEYYEAHREKGDTRGEFSGYVTIPCSLLQDQHPLLQDRAPSLSSNPQCLLQSCSSLNEQSRFHLPL